MSNTDKNLAIIDRYEEAFFRLHGKAISVVASGSGWYKLEHVGDYMYGGSVKRYRLSEIEIMNGRIDKAITEAEAAAEREGFVIFVIPPRGEKHANMKNYYLTEDDGWFTDKSDSSVKVFELASTASDVVNEINKKFPFTYAAIEPF